jgi:hypothetical protein
MASLHDPLVRLVLGGVGVQDNLKRTPAQRDQYITTD